MANLDRKPFWTQEKEWDPSTETSIRKQRFENSSKIRSVVIPDDGLNGIEFFIALTYTQFLQAYKEQDCNEVEGYSQLAKVLNGTLKTAWEETMDDDYSDDADRTNANWDSAIDKLIIRFLNCKKPRNVQWRYHKTGYQKHPFDSMDHHFRRFKESIHHTRRLPKGVKPGPSEEEVKEWYFRTYCKKHRFAFLATGKDLDATSMEDITEFMRLKHEADLNDGTLHRLSNERRPKSNGRTSRNVRDEKPFRKDARHRNHQSDSRRDRSHDGSPVRKSYRDERSNQRQGRTDRRPSSRRQDPRSRDNHRDKRGDSRRPRSRDEKPDFYHSDKRDCHVYKPCKHTWEECSTNPRNKKPAYSRKHESHHQQHDDDSVSSAKSSSSKSSHDSHESACSSRGSIDNYHIGASNSMSSEEERIPRKQTRFKKVKARKPTKTRKQPIKHARDKAACRKKEQAFLADTSDEEDEFAGE